MNIYKEAFNMDITYKETKELEVKINGYTYSTCRYEIY
ncbi:hypothetical protein HNP76_002057 [Treponema ruminis]|uniref:Uncharacterized protein n=1 Tax=Treponema ruminis TaxID=744515 RepID=A0A7W8GA74_9SPIR|nr:hypothetical protein [Treponema ruminis]